MKLDKQYALPKVLTLCAFWALSACDSAQVSESTADPMDEYLLELDDYAGPIDYGDTESDIRLTAAINPKPIYSKEGYWSRAHQWPISPIHLSLLANGTVLSYGTNPDAQNATGFTFDVWNPKSSNWRKLSSHQTLPTGIDTNLFCSAQTILPTGNVLISGGDRNKVDDDEFKNDGVSATTLYNIDTNTLTKEAEMNTARWYPTLVTMEDGKQLVLGGRDEVIETNGEKEYIIPAFPELYDPESGRWTKLAGATNAEFFERNWYYPRAFLKDDGKVVLLDQGKDGVYELSVQGNGSLKRIGNFPAGFGTPNTTAVMYTEGKILFINKRGGTAILDVQSGRANHVRAESTKSRRIWPDATVLANGEVFLSGGRASGGSSQEDKLSRSVYKGQIWNPDTNIWTDTTAARKARLYHSTTILLPDARVLVAGGGPPGPVVNMNAERFSPPYLFNTDGAIAPRPKIDGIGDVQYGGKFNLVLAGNETISRVTFVRAGSSTHSFDQGQRFMELEFSQTDAVLDITAPANSRVAPPGLYMVFVLNSNGVPSIAKLVMM